MMNISKLTDQEKSDYLCNLADIPKDKTTVTGTEGPEWEWAWPDLYEVDRNGDPLFMHLSWRVLNWADDLDMGDSSLSWGFLDYPLRTLACEKPADAIRLFLDRVLIDAIASGVIKIEATRS